MASSTSSGPALLLITLVAVNAMVASNYQLHHFSRGDVSFLAGVFAIFYCLANHAATPAEEPTLAPEGLGESLTLPILREVNLHILLCIAILLLHCKYSPQLIAALKSLPSNTARAVLPTLGSAAVVALLTSTVIRSGGFRRFIVFVIVTLLANWKAVLWMGAVGVLGGLVGARYLLVTTARHGATKKRVILGRKFFHLIALLVALPLLTSSYEICVLGWTAFVYLFLLEEICRLYNVLGMRRYMTEVVEKFSDERDLESIVVTPLFLALGCQMPMIYAYLTRIAPIAAISSHAALSASAIDHLPPPAFSVVAMVGVLAATIGDGVSALVPNWCCKTTHSFRGPYRSWEGLIAFTVCHFIAAEVIAIGVQADYSHTALAASSIAAALSESLTDHIDNYWVSVQAVCALEAASRLV